MVFSAMNKRQATGLLAGALAAILLPAAALAQGFPNKPITIVVPFAAGSPTDVIARSFGNDFGQLLNTPVVIDNKPGVSQTIAGAYVARAPADGYTLMFANLPAIVAPSLQAKLPYNGLRDFAPVSDVLTIGFVLVASPALPATNLKEFIALLKADPSKYSYGSSGIGTPIHLMAEMFNKEIGVKTLHVPYKGGNQVQLDLMSDRVTYAFLPTGAMEFVRGGKLKGYGLAADKRDPGFPELPTMDEAGMPGFKATVNFVLVGPKQTPTDVVAKMNAAANKVIASDAFASKMKSVGGVEIVATGHASASGRAYRCRGSAMGCGGEEGGYSAGVANGRSTAGRRCESGLARASRVRIGRRLNDCLSPPRL